MKSAKVIFYLKSDKTNKETGEAPIYARITVNGKRSNISINRMVHPDRWESTGKLENARKSEDVELRTYMDSIKSRLKEIERILLDSKINATAEAIKNAYTGSDKKKSKTVLEIIDWHNERFKALAESGVKASSTLMRFKQVRNHMEKFIPWQYHKSDMPIDEIQFSFITNFDFYLRTVRKCNNNSTVKYVRNFRTIIRMAVDQDWFAFDPFQKYKGRTVETQRTFLLPEEIEKIESKVISIERLSVIRDIFLFSVYTGYAYADVKKLTPADIRMHIDKEKWIFTQRLKTKVTENVMLLPKPLQIIEKYKNHPLCILKGTILPVPSNQRVNGYLKEIADICDISKNLTFHVARHSFATSVWLANDGSMESLKEAIGHQNIQQTQHYGKMLNKSVGDEMKKLRNTIKRKDDEDNAAAMMIVK